MGIIDDHFEGYENLCFYTGDVDFDAAYGTSCPWDDKQHNGNAASGGSQNRVRDADNTIVLYFVSACLPRASKFKVALILIVCIADQENQASTRDEDGTKDNNAVLSGGCRRTRQEAAKVIYVTCCTCQQDAQVQT